MARASEADPHEDFFVGEEALLSQPCDFSKEGVLGLLDFALRKSLARNATTAPARYIVLAGRHAGLWQGKGSPVGRKEPEPEPRTRSPAEIFGLPDTSGRIK